MNTAGLIASSPACGRRWRLRAAAHRPADPRPALPDVARSGQLAGSLRLHRTRERELNIQPYEKAIAAGWVISAYDRPEVVAFAIASQIPNIYGTPIQPSVMGEHFGIDMVTGNFASNDEVQADYGNAKYFLTHLWRAPKPFYRILATREV